MATTAYSRSGAAGGQRAAAYTLSLPVSAPSARPSASCPVGTGEGLGAGVRPGGGGATVHATSATIAPSERRRTSLGGALGDGPPARAGRSHLTSQATAAS